MKTSKSQLYGTKKQNLFQRTKHLHRIGCPFEELVGDNIVGDVSLEEVQPGCKSGSTAQDLDDEISGRGVLLRI